MYSLGTPASDKVFSNAGCANESNALRKPSFVQNSGSAHSRDRSTVQRTAEMSSNALNPLRHPRFQGDRRGSKNGATLP